MSNSGIIIFKDYPVGLYLHWNGGRDSVEAFLEYARLRQTPASSAKALIALTTIIDNYFGGKPAISMELINASFYDNYYTDNGVYVVNVLDMSIVKRINAPNFEQHVHDRQEMLLEIDKHQPKDVQLGHRFLKSEEVPVANLNIEDEVFVHDSISGTYKMCTVLGFGKPVSMPSGVFGTTTQLTEVLNGRNIIDVPYVDFITGKTALAVEQNVNNYLFDKTIRKYSPNDIDNDSSETMLTAEETAKLEALPIEAHEPAVKSFRAINQQQ